MNEFCVVNRGVDTVLVNIYYIDRGRPIHREIEATLAVQLDEWKHAAQELGEQFITGTAVVGGG